MSAPGFQKNTEHSMRFLSNHVRIVNKLAKKFYFRFLFSVSIKSVLTTPTTIFSVF